MLLPFPAVPFGVADLSAVTDALVHAIAVQTSAIGFAVTVSGSSPDSVRKDSGCQLSLYLFHIEQDPHLRNAPVMGPRVPPLPMQPMSLNLYYLLTAFADKNSPQEQLAMTAAIRWFYEHPVFSTVAAKNEYTLTMQPESADELGRLWQSIAVPARLSVVYRVGVVFLPVPALTTVAKEVTSYNVVADPADLPFAAGGDVTGTSRTVTYRVPDDPQERTFLRSPAIAAPGQELKLWGAGLGVAPSDHLYLLQPDGTEVEVTSWIVVPSVDKGGGRFTIKLPATAGAPAAGCPAPGIYQLRAGSDGPDPYRSSATPFGIAAAVQGPAAGNPVVLTPAAGTYTIAGVGFLGASTEVLLGTTLLRRRNAGDTLIDGDFLVDAALTGIQFRAPASMEPGNYAVRIRLNQVDSDPAWWISV